MRGDEAKARHTKDESQVPNTGKAGRSMKMGICKEEGKRGCRKVRQGTQAQARMRVKIGLQRGEVRGMGSTHKMRERNKCSNMLK